MKSVQEPDPMKRSPYHIQFIAAWDSSALGRLLSLLIFPFAWIFTGRARL